MMKGNSRVHLAIKAVLCTLVAAALAWGLVQPVVAAPARIYGYVRDFSSIPIDNCYIAISDENYAILGSAYTNEQGYYQVSVGASPTYHVWAGKTVNNLYTHIPQTKTASAGQIDFNLYPGSNIILQAYDQNGILLRNRDFLNATGGLVFATDLGDIPQEAYLGAVHDSQSNWDWNLAIPTFIVRPGMNYKIHLQWEIPGFGQVMLSADNNGQGFSVAQQGGSLSLNLNYELAQSSLNWLKANSDTSKDKDTKSSERHLKTAENYLNTSQIASAVTELNLCLKESLWASEKLVLDRAQRDIEQYRQGELKIRLVDSRGRVIRNAQVSFRQLSHDFLFGVNPLGQNGGYDESLVQFMKQAGVNHTYITVRWGLIESSPGVFDWANIDSYQQVDRLLAQGFKLMGALSLWLCNMADFTPGYLHGLSFEELKTTVYDYTFALVSRYQGKIDIWEVNELNLSAANGLNLSLEERKEIARVFARAAKEANPEALILNGSCALPYEFGDSPAFSQMLKSMPADIVGLEFYYSGVNRYGYAMPQLDLARLSDLLDDYAGLGKPIYIKELAAPSSQLAGSAWWHSPWDEATQAEYLTSVYTLAFSKPQVRAITWGWGVLDADAWTISGGLFEDANNPKLAYEALKKLIDSWTTTGRGKTNNRGEYNLRGFAGDYEISIHTRDGRTYQQTVHMSEQTTGNITIVLNR